MLRHTFLRIAFRVRHGPPEEGRRTSKGWKRPRKSLARTRCSTPSSLHSRLRGFIQNRDRWRVAGRCGSHQAKTTVVVEWRIGELTKVQTDWREGLRDLAQSRISNFNETLDEVRNLKQRDDESRSQGEDGQEARPAQRLHSQLRDGWAQIGKSAEQHQGPDRESIEQGEQSATDDASYRQTAPVEQSQQFSPDTPSAVSGCASEATIQGWSRQHSRSISLLGVKQTLTRLTRTIRSRWTPRERRECAE